jgi:hypothetical protein
MPIHTFKTGFPQVMLFWTSNYPSLPFSLKAFHWSVNSPNSVLLPYWGPNETVVDPHSGDFIILNHCCWTAKCGKVQFRKYWLAKLKGHSIINGWPREDCTLYSMYKHSPDLYMSFVGTRQIDVISLFVLFIVLIPGIHCS